MKDIGEIPVLLIGHLIDFVNFLLQVELVVLLTDVGVILLNGLFNIFLAFRKYLNIDLLGVCQI